MVTAILAFFGFVSTPSEPTVIPVESEMEAVWVPDNVIYLDDEDESLVNEPGD